LYGHHLSSGYKVNSRVLFSENDRITQPVSLYAETTRAGEEIAHAFNHFYGLSIADLHSKNVFQIDFEQSYSPELTLIMLSIVLCVFPAVGG